MIEPSAPFVNDREAFGTGEVLLWIAAFGGGIPAIFTGAEASHQKGYAAASVMLMAGQITFSQIANMNCIASPSETAGPNVNMRYIDASFFNPDERLPTGTTIHSSTAIIPEGGPDCRTNSCHPGSLCPIADLGILNRNSLIEADRRTTACAPAGRGCIRRYSYRPGRHGRLPPCEKVDAWFNRYQYPSAGSGSL